MTDKLVYKWFVEYDSWRMLTEFLESGSLDGIPNFRCSAAAYNPRDAENAGSTYGLLIWFIYKISEAANDVGGVNTEQTTLEDAIDLLDQISRCYREVLDRDQLKEVQMCLKSHAVMAPLRYKDRAKAKVAGHG